MHIIFLQTGGTIDKHYPRGENDHGYQFSIGEPAFGAILRRANVSFSWDIRSVMKKDSLDMTLEDRTKIAEAVNAIPDMRVVITHSTDTIHQTAKVIAEHAEEKVIVLTGSLLPEKFRDTDADFNLGMAVGAVQSLPPGVYIALYGEVKPWSKFKHT